MTKEIAEKIFHEFGDVLANQLLNKPEKYGKNLKGITRMKLRKAILIWVAKEKYEGKNILSKLDIAPGKKYAVLELADNVWPFTSLFGPPNEYGLPILDTDDEKNTAIKMHDDIVDFLLKINPEDSDYWNKIKLELKKF